MTDPYPSLKAGQLLRLLTGELGYTVTRQRGSHRKMESDQGHGSLLFSFHDRDTIAPGLVRKILVKDVGLTDEQARSLL